MFCPGDERQIGYAASASGGNCPISNYGYNDRLGFLSIAAGFPGNASIEYYYGWKLISRSRFPALTAVVADVNVKAQGGGIIGTYFETLQCMEGFPLRHAKNDSVLYLDGHAVCTKIYQLNASDYKTGFLIDGAFR